MNESFWDAQGIEIEACAIWHIFEDIRKHSMVFKFSMYVTFFEDRMLWVVATVSSSRWLGIKAVLDAIFGSQIVPKWHSELVNN